MLSLKLHSLSLTLVLAAVLMLLALPAAAEDFNNVQSEIVGALDAPLQQSSVSPASVCRGDGRVRDWWMRNTPNIRCQGVMPNRIFLNWERITIPNRLPNRSGSLTYQCRNGRWTIVSGSCVAVGSANCRGGFVQRWNMRTTPDIICSGNVPNYTFRDQQTINIPNTAANRRGNVNMQCRSGRWHLISGSCIAVGTDPLNPYQVEAAILNHTNTYRRSNQGTSLVRDARLDAIARGYALRMARDGWRGHRDIESRFAQGRSIGYRAMGENEAWASYRLQSNDAWGRMFTNMWWNSAGHRRNMLNPSYTHIGIGFVRSGNSTAAVQFFGGR